MARTIPDVRDVPHGWPYVGVLGEKSGWGDLWGLTEEDAGGLERDR